MKEETSWSPAKEERVEEAKWAVRPGEIGIRSKGVR